MNIHVSIYHFNNESCEFFEFCHADCLKSKLMTMGSANENEWLRQHSIVFAIACDMREKKEWDEKYSKNSFNSLLKLPT